MVDSDLHFQKNTDTQKQPIKVALAGNPNSGKTTIFNNLTGSHQHVANYGGVTVETKEGTLSHKNLKIKVVDLPGTYSLSAYSIEEIVTRNYILKEKPDVVINVVDGSNLERNLYLTVQLLELGVPLIVVLNMADEMKNKGFVVDMKTLSRDLGAPVVPTVGTRNTGTSQLIKTIVETVTTPASPGGCTIHYGNEIDAELEKMSQPMMEHHFAECKHRPDRETMLCKATSPRWVALKLLENDREVIETLYDSQIHREVENRVRISRNRLTRIFGEDPETIIAEQRYGYVRGLCRSVVRHTAEARMDISDKIDKVLTHRLLGLPIFALLMYATFWLVFTIGDIPMGWIDSAEKHLVSLIHIYWPEGSNSSLRSLITDGIIAGVGGVLLFVPNIILLFLAITLLEDSGYMARAAFIMDRMLKWVGLHGKSFIPMMTGFGCSVPAIMGTRILENRRDRIVTILVLPLMSCGARMPIYAMISPLIFPQRPEMATFTIYITGILIAIVSARLLRSTVFKGEASPFVMELPPYRIPTARAIAIHLWQRTWMYLKKAGTIILAFSILMWALTSYPKIPSEKLDGLSDTQIQEESLKYTVSGRLGRTITPMLETMGFDWKIGTALIGAFPAKELFVSQMGIVYSLGETDPDSPETLQNVLQRTYSPLVCFCIMLFCLIATPCIATVAVTKRETGSWGWALAQLGGLTLIAYILTVIVYQIGTILHIGTQIT